MPRSAKHSFATVREIMNALPGAEEGTSYGTPAFRVKKKFLLRMWEDGETLVVKCGFDERDFRTRADPETFFTTDHYRGYPTVLVRLSKVRRQDLEELLVASWRRLASPRLQAQGPAPR
jgi:hypothetical protein